MVASRRVDVYDRTGFLCMGHYMECSQYATIPRSIRGNGNNDAASLPSTSSGDSN